jgi:hypothetical protein
VIARHIDSLTMLGVGLWTTAVGFRVVALDPEDRSAYVRWFKRNARWMGPALVVIALVLLVTGQA